MVGVVVAIGTGEAFPLLGAAVGTGFAAVGEAEADGTALADAVVPAAVARAVGVAGALADCDAPDDA